MNFGVLQVSNFSWVLAGHLEMLVFFVGVVKILVDGQIGFVRIAVWLIGNTILLFRVELVVLRQQPLGSTVYDIWFLFDANFAH